MSSFGYLPNANAGSNVNLSTGRGYLALPKSSEPAPTILMIHDDSGIDVFVKEEVDRWAERGFVALAVDLYQGSVAADLKEAARMRDRLDTEFAEKMLSAGLAYVQQNPRVDKTRIGVLAWGMGADRSLSWAKTQTGIRLWVLYDVQPDLDVKHLQKIKGRLLAIYADQDKALPEKLVQSFEKQLREAQINYEIKKFQAKSSKYWDYTKGTLYEAKPAQAAREFLQIYLEKYLTLSDHRK